LKADKLLDLFNVTPYSEDPESDVEKSIRLAETIPMINNKNTNSLIFMFSPIQFL